MLEPPLTSAGQSRREAILRLMQETARRKRRRRQMVQTTAACAVALIMISLVIHWRPHNGGGGAVPTPTDYATTKKAPIVPPKHVAVVIGRIETDPTILQRWSLSPRVKPEQAALPTIDDDDLIRTLADAGQSAGLIQVGGETTLIASSAAQQ